MQADQHASTPHQERCECWFPHTQACACGAGRSGAHLLRALLGAGAAGDDVHGRLAREHAPQAVAAEQQEAVAGREVHRAALGLRGHAHPATVWTLFRVQGL